jgi:hypothetical protein
MDAAGQVGCQALSEAFGDRQLARNLVEVRVALEGL